jgi:hypothetical protein
MRSMKRGVGRRPHLDHSGIIQEDSKLASGGRDRDAIIAHLCAYGTGPERQENR